jgi:acyl-CoA thioester hydrolase
MQFLLEVRRAAERLIDGEVIYVLADPSTRRPKDIPAFLRTAVSGYETTAPEVKAAARDTIAPRGETG